MKRVQIAVIGAGMAGLAAARELRRRGHEAHVFEARQRIGGRVFTMFATNPPVPVELGAEFVHGEAPQTERIARTAGLSVYDVRGEHLRLRGKKLEPVDYWGAIDRLVPKIDTTKPDMSIADFLADQPGGHRLARDRTIVHDFVQGFHAADVRDISAHSISPEEGEQPSDSAGTIGRIVGGQSGIARWLAAPLGSYLHLGAAVREIAWKRHSVELTVETQRRRRRIVARAAIVTLPVGVLKAPPGAAGAVAFTPEIPRIRRALDHIGMGSVTRIGILLRGELDAGHPRMSFLHLRDSPFNVCWTAYPLRQALVVAWCAGPTSRAFAGRGREVVLHAAIGALASNLRLTRRQMSANVLQSFHHDWDRDSFARGAYSYVRVGGGEPSRVLARPVDGTLFFAGEATQPESGTVEAALASGIRAARQVDQALG